MPRSERLFNFYKFFLIAPLLLVAPFVRGYASKWNVLELLQGFFNCATSFSCPFLRVHMYRREMLFNFYKFFLIAPLLLVAPFVRGYASKWNVLELLQGFFNCATSFSCPFLRVHMYRREMLFNFYKFFLIAPLLLVAHFCAWICLKMKCSWTFASFF